MTGIRKYRMGQESGAFVEKPLIVSLPQEEDRSGIVER
jgi:hypothetical protein